MFTLTMRTENDAFHPEPAAEVARILRHIADRVEAGTLPPLFQTIFDSNGNDVGRFKLSTEGGK
jgi:hypothetical protein